MSTDLASQQVLLIGLPEAGKTTFIAALWHVLTSNEVENTLKVTVLGGDDEYLTEIRDSWISYEPLGRTSQQNESIPSINLTDSSRSRRCLLLVPDLSGETYRSQWVDREWTEKFEQLATQSTGMLVFVHPEQNIEPTEITTTQRFLPTQEPEEPLKSISSSSPQAKADPETVWDAERANDVVQLVDVLQAFQDRLATPLRIAVVVSAWDLVKDYFDTPEDYLSRKLAILDQYLRNNSAHITFELFGVSATGVSLTDAEGCEAVQAATTVASQRITVSSDSGTDHDITRPLRWVLQW